MNGMGQQKDGRGNIAPTTIIMPKLAMMAKGEIGHKDIDDFMKILDKKIFEAKNSLIDRYQWIASQNPSSATFMYENGTMKGYVPSEGIRSALKHGTLAIGQLGLAETLQILIGCDHTEERGMELAKRIEQLFKDRCYEFKHELHRDADGYEYYLNFGVYYTPAENLVHTAMMKFQKEYGKIPNISDRTYFTNSIHVPVWKKMSPFEKIDIESELTGYSSAGCITYIESDGAVKDNLDALDAVVQYAMDKDIPYFAINVPNDQCTDCGYTDTIDDNCPVCGSSNIKRLRRVTGYLTNDYRTAFNKGKIDETNDRVVHLDCHEWNE
jgi:ribonucleoside-triphosphate reductase